MVVGYISRGMAPVQLVYEAMEQAQAGHNLFYPICGKKLIDAKNEAVNKALEENQALLLIEDDIRVPIDLWHKIQWDGINGDGTATIQFAEAVERYGTINVRYNKHTGDLLWTGNVFTKIPLTILQRLPKPVFQSWNFVLSADGSEVIDRGRSASGHHSDAFFWQTVQKLDPKAEIVNIGRVEHIITPFNNGKVTEHQNPYHIKAFPYTGAKKKAG